MKIYMHSPDLGKSCPPSIPHTQRAGQRLFVSKAALSRLLVGDHPGYVIVPGRIILKKGPLDFTADMTYGGNREPESLRVTITVVEFRSWGGLSTEAQTAPLTNDIRSNEYTPADLYEDDEVTLVRFTV